MDTQRLAGALIIVGMVLVIAATLVFPGEYYMAEDEEARQAILDANQSGWIATNWLWIAAGVVTAAGLVLVTLRDRGLLSMAGAGLFAVGSVFWVIYLYLRSLDSSVTYDRLWMEAAFAWLTAGGLALLGIAFLRGTFPTWVGYVNLGYAILLVLIFLFSGTQMYMFFPPQVVYLVALFTGIVAAIRG